MLLRRSLSLMLAGVVSLFCLSLAAGIAFADEDATDSGNEAMSQMEEEIDSSDAACVDVSGSEEGVVEDGYDDLDHLQMTELPKVGASGDSDLSDSENKPTADVPSGDETVDEPESFQPGLVTDSAGLRYRFEDGTYAVNQWIDGVYYFGEDGYAVRYEHVIDGKRYYFDGSGVMQTGWVTWKADGTRTYFGSDGVALSGWQTLDGKRYYFDPANDDRGARWETVVDGKRYYFGSDCSLVTGLVTWKADGRRSYFDPSAGGAAVSGWRTVGGDKYYFDADDSRSLVWEHVIDGKRYYFDGSGVMQTGWVTWKADGTRTYFGSDGVALSGWQTLDGKRYYFDPANDDRGARWETVVDGKRYYFGSDCSLVTGLVTWKADGRRSYFDPSAGGAAVSGWRTVGGDKYYFDADDDCRSIRWTHVFDGKTYYFDSHGVMYKGLLTWKADGTKSFFGSDGVMTSGWQKWENDWYYIDSETMRAVKYMQVIDGKTYYFNSDCIRYSGLLTWNADGTKSYFDSNGVMASGWQTWKGDKYYISPSTMRAVKYKQVISGKTYYFESSCAMHTGWLQWNADKKWSYFGSNGVMYTGTHTIDGVKYNFGSSGKVNTRYSTDQSKMLDKIKNYSSKTKYLIAVNRSTHKVGVFVGSKGNWTYKYYWSCVTGASGSPTITGSYYTTGFKRTKLTTDSRAKWATQINGGYFFHSILASESELGKSLSHGCIRLATSNAKWIYNNIYAGTRVVIYG